MPLLWRVKLKYIHKPIIANLQSKILIDHTMFKLVSAAGLFHYASGLIFSSAVVCKKLCKPNSLEREGTEKVEFYCGAAAISVLLQLKPTVIQKDIDERGRLVC